MTRGGLTGGIGSGKSMVARFFSIMGIPVYNADSKARSLMQNNSDLKHDIIKVFGNNAYLDDNKLNSVFLSQIVFTNQSRLEQLNKLVHPYVEQDFDLWAAKQSAPYSLIESAILFESGFDKLVDFTVMVWAPVELRIKRTGLRDNLNNDQIMQRMQAQGNQEQWRNMASFCIINDDSEAIIPQVLKIHQIIIQ